jgi:ATP-dependent helicase/nuclease subunit A
VISSVQPHIASELSWWQRLQAYCEPLPAPRAVAAPVVARSPVRNGFLLPVVPAGATDRIEPARAQPVSTEQSRFGEAMHRLLEFHAGKADWSQAQLARVARDFSLDGAALEQAIAMARRILTGEGAWAWDPARVDWQGNEVELLHRGELLRLDRLVRSEGQWWVLDYKSASRPELDPALVAKMRLYREAVANANPGAVVNAAFLTGHGKLVPVE